jgi:nicotinamidase-related amidase
MRYAKTFASSFALLALMAHASDPARSVDADVTLRLRTRIQPFHDRGPWEEAYFDGTIATSRTAIVITDMWDKHWCTGATNRVGQIVLRMEPVLEKARSAGILIIHAPSDTMNFYVNDPGRLLAENAPQVTPPQELNFKDAPLPIDDSDEGCDTPGDKPHTAWKREHPGLTIAPGDVISDKGAEIYNVLREHHIDTVLYMGVHANMCILNRTFGVRQMSKWGLRCIIVRDLMDAMYNPAAKPYVSHAAGTELVYEFIEQYWAPSTTSSDLLAGLAGSVPASSAKGS